MGRSVPPLRAVIFDWGGTLTPWHTFDPAEQWSVYARVVHGDDDHASADLSARILAAEGAAWQRARTGQGSAHMDDLLREVGIDPFGASHEAALAAYREFWEPHTITDEQVLPLWEGLRERGIRVGVLSNTIWPRDYHRGVFERDGVLHLIDADVYSSEIDWTKPDAKAFHASAAALGVEPSEAAYVGDRPFEDVHGSKAAGMRAIWVPHSEIPVAQQVSVDAIPDGIAQELLDILGIVDRWQSR
jgi:putative hydrolase of the HAD superfamily